MYLKSISLSVFVCLATMVSIRAQSGFEWGMAAKELEPSEQQISLALAGYGLPVEGRFSITWEQVKTVPATVAVCFYNGKLLLATPGRGLLQGDTLPNTNFLPLKNAPQTVSGVTAGEKALYLLCETGITKCVLKNDKLQKKVNILLPPAGLRSLVENQGRLYGVDAEGGWFRYRPDGRKWEKIGQAGAVRSVTSIGQRVYLLKEDETLWCGLPDDPVSWRQVGRKNGYTWKGTVYHIAGIQNRLYAIDSTGQLLLARHQSDHSLSVSSLVIGKNGKQAVLIGADVCGLQYAFTSAVKDSLKQRFGIVPEAVLINSSHTHFAPVTQEWKAWAHFYHTPDSSYLYNEVMPAMIASVGNALKNMSVGDLSFRRGQTAIGKNRRPANNPEKPYDPSLDLLTITKDNELQALLFLTGCHPVFPNKDTASFTISANYPGAARNTLSKSLGLKNSLFLQGCGGDINPVAPDYHTTGTELAGDVIKTLRQDAVPVTGDIFYQIDSLQVPVSAWSKEKILAFRKENTRPDPDIYAEKNIRWANIMLQHLEQGTMPAYMPIYIQTIHIGNWLLVGISREAVTEYGINIKKEWPDKMISVAGYSNDVSSYLPVKWHIETKVYEGYESSFWYGQPDLFPGNILELVMEKVRSLVL